ncbi:PPK2 family polyphosphate:nucleotide phosphotransferase [Friedmanniella endophytica]|uniref:PPK2 family polyphosphate:nucleotide phosphotransferase n=1 Tax=Microlunatus kandeliicorticis TaxID=1759536 RepID=A0A7W3P6C1_9ACTN|nr:PPK2 family polyphosphate kinase [Microlunatus kandeliicorticis]MBA8794896.1 PPK2 family polyphosphate:nucleotide phosphotransferase [Microlunatus kandeliicorticis]
MAKTPKNAADPTRLSDLLRLPQGPVDLGRYDPRATPGFVGGKKQAPAATAALAPRLDDLQERLFAAGRAGTGVDGPPVPSVLVVLQGMDTSGKGGVIRHAIGLVDPQGVQISAFKAPTRAEKRHDFLWRIRRRTPAPGTIGIFDRSHYEDVLIVRVHELVPESEWSARYEQINAFEAELAAAGTTVLKCYLHISADEQRQRLLARLDDPSKYWKYNPGDVDERALWPSYLRAYEDALEQCNTTGAPWHLVPADRKWYRNWAVAALLLEHLEALHLQWPPADFDVETERSRLL